jgi:hypothetical protein
MYSPDRTDAAHKYDCLDVFGDVVGCGVARNSSEIKKLDN